MFVLGGPVHGGKVYGRWPGLAPEVLYKGRDLDLTTDDRTVCAEVLARHMAQRELGKSFLFPRAEFAGARSVKARAVVPLGTWRHHH